MNNKNQKNLGQEKAHLSEPNTSQNNAENLRKAKDFEQIIQCPYPVKLSPLAQFLLRIEKRFYKSTKEFK